MTRRSLFALIFVGLTGSLQPKAQTLWDAEPRVSGIQERGRFIIWKWSATRNGQPYGQFTEVQPHETDKQAIARLERGLTQVERYIAAGEFEVARCS